jgi:adenine/guanine phosphoribosyltransferase-like PRPP-binding protein
MDRWSRATGARKVAAALERAARDASHGYRAEALGKIVGAVALGFVNANRASEAVGVSVAEIYSAVESYRATYPEPALKEQNATLDVIAKIIRKATGVAPTEANKAAGKIIEQYPVLGAS